MSKIQFYFLILLLTLIGFLQACGGGGGGGGSNSDNTSAVMNCNFGGMTVTNGSNITAYQSASVPFGSSCSQETRTCSNGALSGSFQFSSCIVEADTTPPTVSITIPSANQDTVGTATYELTFSEAVSGLSGNNLAAACEGNVQLTSALGGNCYPLTITSSDSIVWSVDPDGELSDGDYRLSVLTSGIQDFANNSLAVGASVEFQVRDALSTVLNTLQADLADDGLGSSLITSIISDVTADTASLSGKGNASNTLADVVPVALGSALDAIEAYPNLSESIETVAIESVFNSLMGIVTVTNLNTPSARSTAAVDSGFTLLFGDIATLIGEKISSALVMEKVMGAFVKSFSKAGVTNSADIGSYVTTISMKATTALINRVDTNLDLIALLNGISTGMATGAAAVSADAALVATVNSAVATGMTEGLSNDTVLGIDPALPGLLPDIDPPTIISKTPTNGATGVAVGSSLTITFSEEMDASTINTTSITVIDSFNNVVSGVWTYSGTTAAFNPSSDLSYGTQYTVTVGTSVADEAGNAASSSSWSFTTISSPSMD